MADKVIGSVKFSVFSPDMIRKLSTVKVTVADTYDEDGYPINGGLMDQAMGVIDPGLKCKTCGGRMHSCSGHFGSIELVRPTIHVGYAKIIYTLLKATCRKCGRLMLTRKQIEQFTEAIAEEDRADELLQRVKKVSTCPHCGEKQADIKFEKPTAYYEGDKKLLPIEVRERLERIPNEDLKMLGIDADYVRPEWMVSTVMLVPPVPVRPSITLETGERSEDDLTHKLVDILRINQRLSENIDAGAPQLIIEDLWELLQYHVTTYFDNETAGIPPARHRSGRPLKTLSQRLKGKEGRFRYNLSGKRVNFSARTVVSPDPGISINEVGVPQEIAEELTVPIAVTEWNIEEIKRMITSDAYPRVNYVLRSDGKRKKVTDKTKEEIVQSLTVGSIAERQMINGDIVLFNRQPSLHRVSIMCHSAVILPGRTFKLNLCVCPPYNADFDGDEMNLHVPQTVESRVEADQLMKVQDHIVSPRNGRALIKPEEDHVSGAYFLTRGDASFGKADACAVLSTAGVTELPKPVKGGRYLGKDIFSMLLPDGLSVSYKSKLCKKCANCKKERCEHDAYVSIKNGKLLSGTIESRGLGGEILETIVRDYGSDAARDFLDRVTRAVLRVISKRGFSVDMSNYTLPAEAHERISALRAKAISEVDAFAAAYQNKTLERLPGRSLRETYEERVMEVLSKTRDACGRVVEESLGADNTSIVMAKIGARGSLLNAIQMAAMLGQQAVRGKRIARGYRRRTLMHFRRGDVGAFSRGFVFSPFTKGLTPTEYFFHSVGGRESLVNTAIRTARSGYMQRRLINALQDLIMGTDGTVRDSRNVIVQFSYGEGKIKEAKPVQKQIEAIPENIE
jgi:DNA-directed RNA polymerase subunit A'